MCKKLKMSDRPRSGPTSRNIFATFFHSPHDWIRFESNGKTAVAASERVPLQELNEVQLHERRFEVRTIFVFATDGTPLLPSQRVFRAAPKIKAPSLSIFPAAVFFTEYLIVLS